VTLLDRYRGFVFDLDGTVYLGDELLPGARGAIETIRAANRAILYVTNKPLDPPSAYAAKLTRLGVPTAADEVISSLDALLAYLLEFHPQANVLCISEPLLATTLAEHGFGLVTPDEAERADIVAVSFDRTFDYVKLHAAFRAVAAGAEIVATNPDRYCPTPEGGLPDCAAMLAAIEACTGRQAAAVVGKPSAAMAQSILARLGLAAADILMVGDRLETDVAMARNAGIDAALVLSGATSREAALRAEPAPTYVLDGLEDLVAAGGPLGGRRP
jgi:HAD superfamily hydrolase (TIGR01450 family)